MKTALSGKASLNGFNSLLTFEIMYKKLVKNEVDVFLNIPLFNIDLFHFKKPLLIDVCDNSRKKD